MNGRRPPRILATIVVLGLASLHAGFASAATTVYVNNANPSCLDAGPGTPASPYCSISAALNAHHAPGDSILVLPGVYRERVNVPASGLPGSPIVLRGLGSAGGPVVVTGADDYANPAFWVPFSGAVWRAPSVTWTPKQVLADSARLALSTAAPAALPANSFAWVAGQGLYVNVGGDNPGTHSAEVGDLSFGFYVAGRSWVVIDGFSVTRTEFAGIELTNLSSNISVTHNVATFANVYGIQVDSCTAVLVGSNVASDNLSSGIVLTTGSTGCTVQDNESFRNLTPNLACGIFDYGAPTNLIQRNRVHDNAYNGIMMSAGANNTVLVQNQSWNNAHQGIEDIFCTGNIHVGDVSYGNVWNGFAIEGGATGTALHNCIAINNGIVFGTANLEVDAASTPGLASNDNLFWNPTSRPVVRIGTTNYLTVAAFTAVSGQDSRTIQADPRFADPEDGDFRLTIFSPAIDAANSGVAGWPATDANGAVRVDDPVSLNTGLGPVDYADRGAFEYVPTGASPTATVPYFDHVIVVVMENQSYATAKAAPYISGLVSANATFSEYYGTMRPSQPNYFSLWSGSTQGILTDDCPPVGAPYAGENLGQACEAAGFKWKAYSEDLPAAGSSVCSASPTPDGPLYTRNHSPWVSFTNVNHANEVPYTQLAADIAAKALPNLAFVIPNNCHNGHNSGCPLSTVDAWLASELPAMLSGVGPWGLVVLTWDEDDGLTGDRILTVMAGPTVKPGSVSHRFVNHYTLLRTICDGLGIAPFGAAAAESPVTDVWAARTTGVRNPPGGGTATRVGPGRPNPFRAITSVSLTLASPALVSAEVYDLAGRRVRTLRPALLSGAAEIRWDGGRDDGAPARPGVYLVRVRTGGAEYTRRVIRLE
jgi:parallel beta-helix repeat protein